MRLLFIMFCLTGITACQSASGSGHTPELSSVATPSVQPLTPSPAGIKRAYFASGCFWCVEAIYESVIGVKEVVSGYAGGKAEDASYDLVSAGVTDHAETVLVEYDANLISFSQLVDVFFDSHDPTTPDQQGPDHGRQYRSAIFYTSEEEKQIALEAIRKRNESKVYASAIVTEVVPFNGFYAAEEYHQDFEKRNPNQGYVRAVSIPRLKKFQKKRPDLLKPSAH